MGIFHGTDLIDRSIPFSKLDGSAVAMMLGFPPTIKDLWWVDSNANGAANRAGHGRSSDLPFETIAYAVANAENVRGTDLTDIGIVAMPGHTESIIAADGWPFGAVGVWIKGLGWGARRPTITFATSTAAQLKMAQASCVLQNLLFINSIDDIVNPFAVNGADCALLDIEYREDSGDEAIDVVKIAGHRTLIDGIKIIGDVGGNTGQSAINMAIARQDVVIRNFDIYGDWEKGCIENVSFAITRLLIDGGRGSYLWTKAPEDLAIALKSDTTGFVNGPIRARLNDNAANIDEAFVGAAMQWYNTAGNIIGIVNADGESELQWPGTPSTDA